jgi:hypothetical protein
MEEIEHQTNLQMTAFSVSDALLPAKIDVVERSLYAGMPIEELNSHLGIPSSISTSSNMVIYGLSGGTLIVTFDRDLRGSTVSTWRNQTERH